MLWFFVGGAVVLFFIFLVGLCSAAARGDEMLESHGVKVRDLKRRAS